MATTQSLAQWPVALPALADGETLYGWCGRFHNRAFSGNALTTSRLLFGSNYAALLHDFPAQLSAFVERTEGCLGSARKVALNHTLLGYFIPFLDAPRGEGLLSEIAAGSVPDLKMRLGIPASGVGGYHPLRCCKECIEHDRRTVGWPLWHLAHQAPSALVCVWHQRPLVQTWHSISPVHRREWIFPDASPASDRHEISLPHAGQLELHFQLAKLSTHCFGLGPGAWNSTRLCAVYRRWARDHGAMTKAGSVRHSFITIELADRFDLLRDAFRTLPFAPIDLQVKSIISAVIRRSPKQTHPLKHLALLIAMFGSAAKTLDALDRSDDVFPAASTANIDPAAHEMEGRNLLHRKAQFLASISQGVGVSAAALAAGVSTSTGVRWARQHGVHFIPRAKVLVESLAEQVRSELRKGRDRKDVATEYGISLASINRLLSTEHQLRDDWRNVRHDAARLKNRERLTALIQDQPLITSTQLRRTPGSGWTWLYRHDKTWLEAALPTLWSCPHKGSETA